MKVLRTAGLGSNFTSSYEKKNVVYCVKISFFLISLRKHSGISLSYSISHQSHWRTTEYNS